MLPVQLDMALSALGWGTRDLAKAAKVSLDTIGRFKRGEAVKERTVDAMRHALEGAGVIFISRNGEGSGVRLNKQRELLMRLLDVSKSHGQDTWGVSSKLVNDYLVDLECYYASDGDREAKVHSYASQLQDIIGRELNRAQDAAYLAVLDAASDVVRKFRRP